MAGPGIRVVGVERAVRTMQAAEARCDDLTREAPEAGQILEDSIRAEEPVKSGRMRAGTRRRRATRGVDTVEVDVVYAGVINYGWPGHNIEANPFGERGMAAAEPRMADELEHGLQRVLDDVRGA